MKKQELFNEIFNFSKRLNKEFAEYTAFWEQKTGLKHYRPSKARDKSLELLLYALKRYMVLNREIVAELRKKGEPHE